MKRTETFWQAKLVSQKLVRTRELLSRVLSFVGLERPI